MFALVLQYLLLGQGVANPFNETSNTTELSSWNIWPFNSAVEEGVANSFNETSNTTEISSWNIWPFNSIVDSLWSIPWPKTVLNYVNTTLEKGEDLVNDVYDDLQEDIVKTVVQHVDELAPLGQNIINRLSEFSNNVVTIFSSLSPLDDYEREKFGNDLKRLTNSLDELKTEVEKEKKEEATAKGVDKILTFITLSRGLLSETYDGQKIVWDKVKQLQVELYKVMNVLGTSSSDFKTQVKNLVDTLKKIDVEDIGSDEGSGGRFSSGKFDLISDDEDFYH